jgi:serine/threonine protein phosphatase 1
MRMAELMAFTRRAWARDNHAQRDLPSLHQTLPDQGHVVYAIGDIHGCLDQLKQLELLIADDAAGLGQRPRTIVVLGDFIDRGPHSAQVIEHLIAPPPPGFNRVVLRGNHEQALLSFLKHPMRNQSWLLMGGLETLASYNVPVNVGTTTIRQSKNLALSALASIPEAHLDFIRNLPVTLTWGRYLFVHAGLRPGVPVERQRISDLIGIRGTFTASSANHDKIVVHGHALTLKPEHRGNRIGVDIGAYANGALAAVRLNGVAVDFLVTGQTRAGMPVHH